MSFHPLQKTVSGNARRLIPFFLLTAHVNRPHAERDRPDGHETDREVAGCSRKYLLSRVFHMASGTFFVLTSGFASSGSSEVCARPLTL